MNSRKKMVLNWKKNFQLEARNEKGLLVKFDAPTEHGGEECFSYCNEQSGHCSWCGTEGICCRKYFTGDGCDGLIGGEDKHRCVPKPGIVYSFKSS